MLPIRYPLDPTGTNPDNLVRNEPHSLTNRQYRAIVLDYGAFYSESLRIVDSATGIPLNGTQYSACELLELPTVNYGKEICSVIIINDPAVSNEVVIDYQALGGEYSYSNKAILQQIDALKLDDRPVAWPAVLGKPDAYPPSMHLHDAGDVFGFEYVVHAIDRLRAAVELGDAASHDAILAYVDKVKAALETALYNTNQELTAHSTNTGNPHETTAAQVGAYSIPQMNGLLDAINTGMTAHTSNQSNPHKVTAAQVGTYTSQALDAMFGSLNQGLDTHKADLNNPHKVTATQLNLGNVPNYPAGTAQDYTNNNPNVLVTPPLVRQGIAAHSGSGDHDSRYILRNSTAGGDGNVQVSGGAAFVLVSGSWKQFWPPTYQ